MTRADWIFRPILWFTTASTIHVVFHETAHAITGVALGQTATLHQYWVDWSGPSAPPPTQAAIGASGPVFSLIAGLCALFFYRARSRTAAGLPLLYLAAIGMAMFFGNLMSAAFIGDFSRTSEALGLSMAARYAVTVVGAAGTATITFWLGRELRQWIPDRAGRVFGVIAVVVFPVVAGTAIVILVNQPVPAPLNFISARLGEQAFQVFAVIGAATGARQSSAGRSFRLWWMDGMIAVATVLAVRLMVRGVHLAP